MLITEMTVEYVTTVSPVNGIGTNFGVGVEEARPEGPRAGDGVLGEVTASPSPPTRGFSCILSRQIAFPSISVRVAYSLHG